MKTNLLSVVGRGIFQSIACAFSIACIGIATTQGAAPIEPVILDSGPHHRVWQTVTVIADDAGRQILKTNSFTELATGLNWLNPKTGHYEESQAKFEITPTGYAVAT